MNCQLCGCEVTGPHAQLHKFEGLELCLQCRTEFLKTKTKK